MEKDLRIIGRVDFFHDILFVLLPIANSTEQLNSNVNISPGSALGQELLNTGKKFMAESGRDNYYSCGQSFTNKNILDRKAHTGKNNLGAFLIERRDSLR